jgi:ABC-type transport system involved in cytochrome c biogenesis ATPase subunit
LNFRIDRARFFAIIGPYPLPLNGHMSTSQPSFRLNRVHIRGLRGLTRVNLPEDGMSWANGEVPNLVVVAGANGSGKTTLLRCLTQAARCLVSTPAAIPSEVAGEEVLIDFDINDGNTTYPVRFLVGAAEFVDQHMTDMSYGYIRTGARPSVLGLKRLAELRQTIRVPARLAASRTPGVVFVPADDRDLVVPTVKYRAPGQLAQSASFVSQWDRPGPGQWSGSTIELLFSARWADLNAKEAGRPDDATNFERYVRVFNDVTGSAKNLAWTTKGDLVVKLADGGTHPVEDLSAGERQLLLLLAELRRLWRYGSLILIDEPELHLHDQWQARLLVTLAKMQSELGGQVILATQSHSLFKMAGLGTRVILGRSGDFSPSDHNEGIL